MQELRTPQEAAQWLNADVSSQQPVEELFGAFLRQSVKPKLRIESLAAPVMSILRTIIDEQENPCCWQAIDEAVENPLGFRIDPVQILDHNDQRLQLTLAQQQTLDRL